MVEYLAFEQIITIMHKYYDVEFIDSDYIKCTKLWFEADPHLIPHRFFIHENKIELQSLSGEPYVADKENITEEYLEKCIESAFKTGKLPEEANGGD